MQLSVNNLAARRGDEVLFHHLDFTLSSGKLLTVTGPNGIGKSTLLRIIAGFYSPDDGTVSLEDEGIRFPVGIASHYLGNQNAMKTHLSVLNNLKFWSQFDETPFLSPLEALDKVELLGVEHLPFGVLSTGQKRRVAIARLLLSYRPLWLVDEPTSGLDATASSIFSRIMQTHLEHSGMIVAATHLVLGLSEDFHIALDKYVPEWEEVE